ncbi:MAG TPA: Gfo/Idh/MocA family oxidoreductase [Planctomycetota bacterium]|nr:Gfo/Idh/MocA family oxidoreductase [Planctomycetota bacterium]HUV39197.1 Gfo/Idh/MocA family oxidoreductase [Planctomycetota bacterium]
MGETAGRVGWGVIGCGQIACEKTIPGMLKAAHARLVSAADPLPERLDLVKGLAPDVRACDDYAKLLADDEVEAVYVALPSGMHCQAVLDAAAAGKHILCEKPLAFNAVDARRMVEAADSAGVRLMTAYMSRFGDMYQKALGLLRERRLGTLTLVNANFSYDAVRWYPPESPGGWRWTDPAGGGPLLDVGIYLVFAIRELLDDRFAEVSAASWSVRVVDRPQDDSFVAWFRTARGVPGLLATLFTHEEQRLSVLGEKGELTLWSVFSQKPTGRLVCRTDELDIDETVDTTRIDHFEHYTREVEHFSRAILSGSSHAPAAEDVLEDMKVLDALKESARRGRRVDVPEE